MKKITSLLISGLLQLPLLLNAQGTWTRKADYLNGRRFDFIGYALNGKGYMGTGTYGSINSFLSDWQEFDPVQNNWTLKSPLPVPFTGGCGFAAGNQGYAACGANDATFIFDTYEYNSIGNNWSARAQFPITRLKATAVGNGVKGYIIGGYDMMALPMNDCWEYDQPSNTWTQRADLPVEAARYYATGFAVSGLIYIFGGYGNTGLLNDLWAFDPVAGTWSQKASLPGEPRQQAAAFVIGNQAYLVGGSGGAGGSLKDFWQYDPAGNQWTRLADFPGATGPSGGVGFAIGSAGYVVCGNGTAECWEYAPVTTGMNSNAVASTVTLYPDPAPESLTYRLQSGETPTSFRVSDASGITVIPETARSAGQQTVALDELPAGLYFIRISTPSETFRAIPFIHISR